MLAALSAAACAGLGAWAGLRLARRDVRLRRWQQALLSVRAACAYARMPPARAVLAGAAHIPQLKTLSERMESGDAALADPLCGLARDTLLTPAERAVLLSCWEALLRGDALEQQQAFDYALARFEAFCACAERARERNARLYVTLGCLGGACIFLTLM